MTTQTDLTPATDKQTAFALKLIAERSKYAGLADIVNAGITKKTASAMIAELLKSPADKQNATNTPRPVTYDFPEGRYALVKSDGKIYFFQVDKPETGKWAGYTFVKLMSSDSHIRVPRDESKQILAAIARDPMEALWRYADEFKVCGICGRGLTDETSRALGIGPVCIKKFDESAQDHAWKLAYARREAAQEVAAYEAKMERDAL